MRELLTDRLRLRAFTDDDVDFVHQVHSHPGVARFICGQVARKYVFRIEPGYSVPVLSIQRSSWVHRGLWFGRS